MKRKITYGLGILFLILGFQNQVYSQVIKDFELRSSNQAPNPYKDKEIFTLRGDFKMIGNTNSMVVNPQGPEQGSNSMTTRYVDIDDVSSTINSSSATLTLPSEDCSKIVYAGLYWSGRAHDLDLINVNSSPSTFNVAQYPNAQWYNGTHNAIDPLLPGYSLTITRVVSGQNVFPEYTLRQGNNVIVRFRYSGTSVSYTTSPTGTNFTSISGQTLNLGTGIYSYAFDDNPLVIGNLEFYSVFKNGATSPSEAQLRNPALNGIKFRVRSGTPATKSLDKRKVKLKMGAESYQEIQAQSFDIHYPATSEGGMYAGYADVTDYVRSQGAGEYFVADLAIREGNGGPTGFYGGWGMVVIYEDVSMPWRDVMVYDGFGHMTANGDPFDLNISGFLAAESGNINASLGVMAGEGDKTITGDYFAIKRRTGNTYDRLNSQGGFIGQGVTPNFFDSSIFAETGGVRNPNLDNNFGIDINRFDFDNQNGGTNRYIGNNDTQTTFRIGTDGDTYIIYNIVLAVDAFVPEIAGGNNPDHRVTINGDQPLNDGDQVEPGDILEFHVNVYNRGTDDIDDTQVSIPIPFNFHFVDAEINQNRDLTGAWQWIPPSGAPLGATPAEYSGGTLVWDLNQRMGTDVDIDKIWATMSYTLKVAEDCTLLAATDVTACSLEASFIGNISGTGVITQREILHPLFQQEAGIIQEACEESFEDFNFEVSVSAEFLQNCGNSPLMFSDCSDEIERSLIASQFPEGALFYSEVPDSGNPNNNLVNGDFSVDTNSEQGTTYYVVTPGLADGCYLTFEILYDEDACCDAGTDQVPLDGNMLGN